MCFKKPSKALLFFYSIFPIAVVFSSFSMTHIQTRIKGLAEASIGASGINIKMDLQLPRKLSYKTL